MGCGIGRTAVGCICAKSDPSIIRNGAYQGMHMTKVALIGATVLAGLLLSGAAQAATVTNGSFEDTTGFSSAGHPGDDTDSLGSGLPGWTIVNHNVAWIGPSNPFGLAASDGHYFLDLTDYSTGAPYGGVVQTISTVFGQHYELSFDLGSSSNYGTPAAITALVGITAQTFTSTLGGTSNWEREVLSFIADGTSTTIILAGASGSNYIGLDHVSVSATPLPGSVLMFLTAMVPLGFRRLSPDEQGSAAASTAA